jgi:hypothetical protein
MSTWTLVQSKAATGSGTSENLTFTSSVTAGNLITVGVGCYSPGTVAVTDSVNSIAYTKAAFIQNATYPVYSSVWWYVPPMGGASFQIQATGLAYPALWINEWSYSSATFSQDATGTGANTTAGTSVSTSSALTIAGPDLIYALAVVNVLETFTAGGGFTLGNGLNRVSSTSVGGQEEYILNQGAGSLTPSISWNTTHYCAFAAVGFTATAGGGFQPWIYGDQIQDWYG